MTTITAITLPSLSDTVIGRKVTIWKIIRTLLIYSIFATIGQLSRRLCWQSPSFCGTAGAKELSHGVHIVANFPYIVLPPLMVFIHEVGCNPFIRDIHNSSKAL
ncbi:hypothetical protein FRC03_007233 [Tulasnella sp. 419]|nr:hypothetical protein FRC03_007233 [Tulasnella sp. 419]